MGNAQFLQYTQPNIIAQIRAIAQLAQRFTTQWVMRDLCNRRNFIYLHKFV